MKRVSVILVLIFCFSNLCFASTEKVVENKDQIIANSLGITEEQVDAMFDKGYITSEILAMSKEQINNILQRGMTESQKNQYLSSIDISEQYSNSITSILATVPSGYSLIATMPYDGGSNEYFHPTAAMNTSTVNTKCSNSLAFARKIFKNSTLSYPTVRYTYYMFGEWGETAGYENWCHEGVDLKHATLSTAAVSSPISGVVTYSSVSNKTVNIYSSALGITMNFQHLNNVDGLGALKEGKPVTVGQFLGNQNATDGHVHAQTCTHASCTQVHSGQDLTLICNEPYNYR